MKKLKLMASLAYGNCLDLGFAHNPNVYLKDTVGVDIQRVPKPENYKEICVLDFNKEKFPFQDKQFDTVLAGDVIEHLENPSMFLREINRVLKKDGKLLLSTPNANYWWTIIHNWFLRLYVNDPDMGEHLCNWTILDMTRLLKLNGFKVIKLWGTECEIPKFNIKISVKNFPQLGWVILYEAVKVDTPVNFIYLNHKNKVVKHFKNY